MRSRIKLSQVLRGTLWLLCHGCAASLLAQSTPSLTQTMSLVPGWNSVFLEVTPGDSDIGAVFSNPSIQMVWSPLVPVSTVAFISNSAAPPFNTAGWLMYVPTNQVQSVNNNLYSVVVNTPYLVNVGGTNPVTVTVTGRPSLRPTAFAPDAFTLRGFPVDPGRPPSFQTFFQSSPAQYPNGALATIYQLNLSSGVWQQASGTDPMARDVVYWVYTTGASSYMAPLSTACPAGDGLDFGQTTFELDLPLTNATSTTMTVTVTDLGRAPHALVYGTVTNQATQALAWLPLTNATITVPANGASLFRVGVQRSQIVNGSYATVLALSDGHGTLLHVPVTAQTPTYLQAGLWVGDISVNAVAEPYNTSLNPTSPTPTTQPFVMRAILHVKPDGTTRFLREVIEMLQTAVLSTNGEGAVITNSPQQYVLLTDNSLLLQPQFTGVALLNGTSVGQRVSTAFFDFDPAGGVTNFLTMSGTFGIGNTVGVSITLSPTTPTNPFLHRYNPEHNSTPNVYAVTRQIQFTFTATDPTGQTATDYGVNEIGGTYNETLLGLNQTPLVVSGVFHLTHTLNVPYLNVVQ